MAISATHHSPILIDTAGDQARRLARLEKLTGFLDDAFRIPVLGYRIGWDSIIGLIPGIGDMATATMSAYIIREAQRMGVPRATLIRMMGNVGVDFVVGSVPILGDFFDVAFKANRKNMRLLRKSLKL